MLQAIAYRGPDDEGIYVNGRVGLGARRLSIIDLLGGRQPISNEDGTIWIVVNGEIYNYKELRRGLEQKGHVFRTASDSEVIIHLYEEMGERCVERLNGMFAFAIWDGQQHQLLLARDRLGQKPLFYSLEEDRFLFASELKAILVASRQPRELDYEALHHYLSLRFIPPPTTMLRHIHKLPPAHTLLFRDGRITLSRYWDLSFRGKLALSEAEFVAGLEEKLIQAVTSHLVSDVPVGAFLSGGMDSSMIVAIMGRRAPTPFKTFAVGVAEQQFNELPHARLVADRYQTNHCEACVQADLIALLPEMIWHLDEPSDPIAACQYHAAALAAQHVKVVLGGDGGDELFAGFDRYLGQRYVEAYARVPVAIRNGVVEPLLARLPENFAYKSLSQKMRWLQRLSLVRDAGERYAEATCFFRFNHLDKQALFSQELWQRVAHLDSTRVIAEQYDRAPADDPIDRMLYADYMTRLPEHSLMLTDRMTMAHGLEARSPYLDHELVEYLAAFPSDLKIRGRTLKHVLRRVARDYLPAPIVKREKHGFMFPVAYWFRNQLYAFVKRYLLDSYFVKEGLFDKGYVLKLVEDHRDSKSDHHVRLWMLLNLAIWHQIYIEQEEPARVKEELQGYL